MTFLIIWAAIGIASSALFVLSILLTVEEPRVGFIALTGVCLCFLGPITTIILALYWANEYAVRASQVWWASLPSLTKTKLCKANKIWESAINESQIFGLWWKERKNYK